MKKTFEEKIRFGLVRFGKKNRINAWLAKPAMAISRFLFGAARYCAGNVKRLSMLAMTFFIFCVFTSFSFPLFASSKAMSNRIEIDEESENLVFAIERDFTEDELAQIGARDADTIDGYSFREKEGLYEVTDEVYDIDEILRNNMDKVGREGYEKEGAAAVSGSDQRADVRQALEEEIDWENLFFSKDDWRLILLNKTHYIPEDYTFPLGTISGSLKCDERILDDLIEMIQAAKKDGISLLVASPYRTHDRQTNNFNRSINSYMAKGMSYMEAYKITSQVITIPDTSEHQVGLALDIWTDTYKSLTTGFGDTAAGKWLAANSYKYGFILRYPEDKEDITCIEYEPWHFRYVGYEAARVMYVKQITLEEFWEEYVE